MSGFYVSNNPVDEEGAFVRSSGWGLYVGTAHSAVSPFVVTQGSTVALPNNAGTKIETQLPSGDPLYDGVAQRVLPNDSGDAYNVRASFTAFTTSNNGGFNITMDISAAGDGSNLVAGHPVRMIRGVGSGNQQLYTVNLLVFSGDTFKANGGRIRIESITGDTSLYGVSYFITKQHKGIA